MSLIPTIAFSSTSVYNNNPFAGLHSYNFIPIFVTFSSFLFFIFIFFGGGVANSLTFGQIDKSKK